MVFIGWTENSVLNWNNVVVIAWLALIFAPFQKLSKYAVLLLSLFLSILYSLRLFQTFFLEGSNGPPADYFNVMNLWVGQWMVNDFYSGYIVAYSITSNSNGVYEVNKSWTLGRIIFTIILLMSYMAAPFGFLLYNIAKYFIWQNYKTEVRINVKNGQDFIEKSYINQLQTDLLNPRYVRMGDKLSMSLCKIYYFMLSILGLTILFTIALPAYIGLVIYCRMIYQRSSSSLYQSTTGSQEIINKRIPEYVRNITADMRLVLITTAINKRNWMWYLKFLLLQIATFIEYIPNSLNPILLFHALQDYFSKIYDVPYFVFGDGIGVGSYELVKRYLQDIPPRKGFESLGWKVSTSQATFCDFSTSFLSSDDPDMKLGRDIIFKWLHAFPYHLNKTDSEVRRHLFRIVPRKTDGNPDKNTVYQAVGEVMFFLATGGELRKNERAAFIDCVKNPLIFFPDWFNLLLSGHYFERKNLHSYYTLLQAFSRHADGPALCAAFSAAENKKSKCEVLKLITIVFAIAGSAAPAKLAVSVIERLWSEKDKQKNVRAFRKNPHNFIKECARLDKMVPMVNVLATRDIATEIENSFKKKNGNIKIYENTPIHCSIVSANRDENIFKNPHDFIPERSELNKLIVWNGVEEDIMNTDEEKRPIRYCPGHDLSLDVIQYVAEQFLPLILDDTDNYDQGKAIAEDKRFLLDDNSYFHTKIQLKDNLIEESINMKPFSVSKYLNKTINENGKKFVLMNLNVSQGNELDQRCYNVLDNYTKLVMTLMKFAVNETNSAPSRAIDIISPFNLPAQDLGIIRIAMAKFIPTWDEDNPNGASLLRRVARWLINQNIWDFCDCFAEFNTVQQAIAWRSKMFPAFPPPNVVYSDMLSDDAMTQLAFAGCACHYTRRVEKPWNPAHGIPEQALLKDAVYVNDITGLSTFHVRQPFERYGAAAYFDKDFKIIGIYWCHASRLVKKGDQSWDHAKYVWRSSFFAYVTIRDHLIVTHMIECNAFVSASRKYLPADHPLRKFLKPFTYHTVSINYQAAVSLVNENGLINRVWAFDYDEFIKVCDYVSMNYTFRLLPDFISETMHPNQNNKTDEDWDKVYPIYHDLNGFWNIIQKYVKNFFLINYNLSIENGNNNLPDDVYILEFVHEIGKQLGISDITSLQRLIDVLSQLIASSTGLHEHVGQMSDYLTDPRFIGTKLQEGREIQNIQTYTQILILSVVTGLRMPGILQDWSHLIPHNQHFADNLENYQIFKQELQNLSANIDSRNKIRNYPFQSFNPKYIDCSTST